MKTKSPTLSQNENWKQLVQIAETTLRSNFSFDTDEERGLINEIIKDYNGKQDVVYKEILGLLKNQSVKLEKDSELWSVIKVGATLLHNLKNLGFESPDNWLEPADVLWELWEQIGKGKWSTILNGKKPTNPLPIEWKKPKFAIDAILIALRNLTDGHDERRIERFFNCQVSDYWKSFMLFWDRIWGAPFQNKLSYFEPGTYKINHLVKLFELVIYRIENFDTEFLNHPDKHDEALKILSMYAESIPKQRALLQKIYIALFKYFQKTNKDTDPVKSFYIIRQILGEDISLGFLVDEMDESDKSLEKIPAEDRGKILLGFSDIENKLKRSKQLQLKVFPYLLAALEHNEFTVIEKVSKILKSFQKELFKYLRSFENSEDKEHRERSNEIFKRIIQIYEGKAISLLLADSSFLPEQKGKLLLADQRLLETLWEESEEPNPDDLLPLILAAIDSKDSKVSKKASNFLKRKSGDIQRKLDILKDNLIDENKASKMIFNAIQLGNDFALKTILNRCIVWVASDQYSSLVDRVSQKIRHAPEAVLPLTNLLNNRFEFQKIKEVKEYVKKKVLEEQQNITIKKVLKDGKLTKKEEDPHIIEELYDWCFSLKDRSKLFSQIYSSQKDRLYDASRNLKPKEIFELSIMILKALENEEMLKRETVVEKWITQLLSEMSDRWFFEKEGGIIDSIGGTTANEKTYEEIKKKLERLAIEPLSKRLPKEENLDIRENLVKILGNIGGRIAVSALVRTVTGEERARAARQNLLSEYYLEPSKAQSEEAARLLTDAVENTKKTMRLLQTLNIATFAMGAILIMGGVTIAIINEDLGSRVIGVLAGLGGLSAIMVQFLKDPLDRIQRALADLVQVQTAFTSFIWELNLNGTYIQSQYVAKGILKDFDLRQTINRIDNSMERTLRLIQIYASGQQFESPPHLHYVIPAENNSIALFGQSLKDTKMAAEKSKLELAINHNPVETGIELWTKNNVMMSIKPEVLAPYKGAGRIWLSLIINGEETNALPFDIGNKRSPVLSKDS